VEFVIKNKLYSYKDLYEKVFDIKGLLKENEIAEGDVVAIISDYNFEH